MYSYYVENFLLKNIVSLSISFYLFLCYSNNLPKQKLKGDTYTLLLQGERGLITVTILVFSIHRTCLCGINGKRTRFGVMAPGFC